MFVVRYGGGWDNPKIAFVTNDEGIAKQLIAQKKQEAFDKQRKFNISWITARKARYNLSKTLLENPQTKETLGEEEYTYLVEEVERQTGDWEWAEKELSKTIDDFYYNDWFYEKVKEINSFDKALIILKSIDYE